MFNSLFLITVTYKVSKKKAGRERDQRIICSLTEKPALYPLDFTDMARVPCDNLAIVPPGRTII